MEVKIGKSAKICLRTGKPFEHGDEVVSLVKSDGTAFIREDYAQSAWNDELGKGAVAVWTTRYHDPNAELEQEQEAASPLRTIFYEAVASEERPDLARAFLAAQLLRRQKAFRLIKESERGDEASVALFVDRVGNRLIEVRDPNLTFGELQQAKLELQAQLEALESSEEEKKDDVQSQ